MSSKYSCNCCFVIANESYLFSKNVIVIFQKCICFCQYYLQWKFIPELILSKSVLLEAKYLSTLELHSHDITNLLTYFNQNCKGKGIPTAIWEIIFACPRNSAQFLVKRHRGYKLTLRRHHRKNRPLKAIYSVYLSSPLLEMHVIYVNTSPLFSVKRKQVVNGDIYGKLVWNLRISNCHLKLHTFQVSDIHPKKVYLWLQKLHRI